MTGGLSQGFASSAWRSSQQCVEVGAQARALRSLSLHPCFQPELASGRVETACRAAPDPLNRPGWAPGAPMRRRDSDATAAQPDHTWTRAGSFPHPRWLLEQVPPVGNWAHGGNRRWAVCAVSACRDSRAGERRRRPTGLRRDCGDEPGSRRPSRPAPEARRRKPRLHPDRKWPARLRNTQWSGAGAAS